MKHAYSLLSAIQGYKFSILNIIRGKEYGDNEEINNGKRKKGKRERSEEKGDGKKGKKKEKRLKRESEIKKEKKKGIFKKVELIWEGYNEKKFFHKIGAFRKREWGWGWPCVYILKETTKR